MRVPPYYRNPLWQRFFVGSVLGAIVSWIIFLFIYGVMQEEQLQQIATQQHRIEDLERYYNILMEDNRKLNEETKNKLKIQDIRIHIMGHERFEIDSLTRHSLIDAVSKDLHYLITKDIESVSKNKEILRKVIENKVYELDEKKYRLQVYALYFDTTFEITLKIALVR